MEVYRRSSGLLLLLGLFLLATTLQGVQGEVESEGPSESECRPYIEKALKELETGEHAGGSSETGESKEDIPTVEVTDDSDNQDGEGDNDSNEGQKNTEGVEEEVEKQPPEPEIRLSFFQRIPILSKFFQTAKKPEAASEDKSSESKLDDVNQEQQDQAAVDDNKSDETDKESREGETESIEEQAEDDGSKEKIDDEVERTTSIEDDGGATEDKAENEGDDQSEQKESNEDHDTTKTSEPVEQVESTEQQQASEASQEEQVENQAESQEDQTESDQNQEKVQQQVESEEDQVENKRVQPESEENESKDEQDDNHRTTRSVEEKEDNDESVEEQVTETSKEEDLEEFVEKDEQSKEDVIESVKKENDSKESEVIKDDVLPDISGESGEGNKNESVEEASDTAGDKDDSKEDDTKEKSEENKIDGKDDDTEEQTDSKEDSADGDSGANDKNKDDDDASDETEESGPVEDLSLDVEVPSELRSRDHVEQLLKLDDRSSDTESIIDKVSEITLKGLKKLYENAIKPLEVLYRYRDLSNRHFGDAEIFSKPLILFMGPWSGGKSSIINYLVNNEYNETSLRTGAEPSPAYFNILMYGDEPEIIDGTELAADFTFSGLQKFGQGLEERLRGVKIPTKLLEKVNIVEIPGILEVRKQVSRVFPFNDACQWFIDRADIIFLIYDPSKLDVGPETEAILDQLKGREHQTRIVLNKADQVKPEELMRVQGALIWNISPLMSSPQPPIMYTASLWSKPYETWAPIRLLQAQERAFLRDLRSAIDKRIENKIASARRFAVRVRNHAKMVDCYLTTYYNHKSVFGNRKQVADEIIEHPQDYHIYEGLSTLTNISRYDLPDPDVYRDFFKLNPLYEFQQLSATCTYFRGCPINRLDVAIAYDLPELVGTYKKLVESALAGGASPSTSAPGS